MTHPDSGPYRTLFRRRNLNPKWGIHQAVAPIQEEEDGVTVEGEEILADDAAFSSPLIIALGGLLVVGGLLEVL